jgi:hypothetical protein
MIEGKWIQLNIWANTFSSIVMVRKSKAIMSLRAKRINKKNTQ